MSTDLDFSNLPRCGSAAHTGGACWSPPDDDVAAQFNPFGSSNEDDFLSTPEINTQGSDSEVPLFLIFIGVVLGLLVLSVVARVLCGPTESNRRNRHIFYHHNSSNNNHNHGSHDTGHHDVGGWGFGGGGIAGGGGGGCDFGGTVGGGGCDSGV